MGIRAESCCASLQPRPHSALRCLWHQDPTSPEQHWAHSRHGTHLLSSTSVLFCAAFSLLAAGFSPESPRPQLQSPLQPDQQVQLQLENQEVTVTQLAAGAFQKRNRAVLKYSLCKQPQDQLWARATATNPLRSVF